MKIRWILLIFLIVLSGVSRAQQSDELMEERLQYTVCALSHDSMMGREAGTPGEKMAALWIRDAFAGAGLSPAFPGKEWFQEFSFRDYSVYAASGTYLESGGKRLKLYMDYYPLGFSANDTITGDCVYVGNGIFCPEKGINAYAGIEDLKGKVFLIELSVPDEFIEKTEIIPCATKSMRIQEAIRHGAAAVIFVCTDPRFGTPSKDPGFYDKRFALPVIFLSDTGLISRNNQAEVSIGVELSVSQMRKSVNVGGYIDNGALNTIVIGAHYDHVGMGASGSRDNSDECHNGADDNASGVAAVIELARILKNGPKNNNYLFLAFSAEESGLIGSEKFLKSGTFATDPFNCYLNFDMIGKLSDHPLQLIGTATSSLWKKIIRETDDGGMAIRKVKAGFGGSDYLPFYGYKIPTLFFHTGLHPDYHTSRDDCNRIDFKGMADVIRYAERMITVMDRYGKIPYKTNGTLDMLFRLTY